MLSYQTIEPYTLELLRLLMKEPSLAETRLVEGTSLALQYGHRSSVDLDLFGQINTSSETLLRTFGQWGEVEKLNSGDKIKCFRINNVKVDIVDYDCPWIDEVVTEDGLRLASPIDIAAMKIYAIENRGSRKDFIDMYFLLKHYSLSEILQFYKRKYPEHSEFVALRSLTYFEDAETYGIPPIFAEMDWEELKRSIIKAVNDYTT